MRYKPNVDMSIDRYALYVSMRCLKMCMEMFQANQVGADESMMLDQQGFVATCNSVNFFCIRKGEVWAPTTKYQVQYTIYHMAEVELHSYFRARIV